MLGLVSRLATRSARVKPADYFYPRLRTNYEADPNYEIQQITIWTAYNEALGPSAARMRARDFILLLIPRAFPKATAQVLYPNPTSRKYIIRGIRERRTVVDASNPHLGETSSSPIGSPEPAPKTEPESDEDTSTLQSNVKQGAASRQLQRRVSSETTESKQEHRTHQRSTSVILQAHDGFQTPQNYLTSESRQELHTRSTWTASHPLDQTNPLQTIPAPPRSPGISVSTNDTNPNSAPRGIKVDISQTQESAHITVEPSHGPNQNKKVTVTINVSYGG
jgi:hypothetical protein